MPALRELRFDALAAARADPGLGLGGGAQRLFDEAPCPQHVAAPAHPQLRPALDERDLAHHAAEAVVAHVAGNPGRLEQVAQVRNLDHRLRGVDLARVGAVAGSIAR